MRKNSGQDLREGDLEEQVQRLPALLHLGPHHGAFPGVDDEPGKRLADLLANERALSGQLGPEISQETPGREPGLDNGLVETLEVFSEPSQRRQFLVLQDAQAYPALLPVSPYCLGGQRLLALEVVVEGALRCTRGVSDVLNAGRVETPP